jgi:hypothetical protein
LLRLSYETGARAAEWQMEFVQADKKATRKIFNSAGTVVAVRHEGCKNRNYMFRPIKIYNIDLPGAYS